MAATPASRRGAAARSSSTRRVDRGRRVAATEAAAFTLIELIVVIMVIALLAAIVLPMVLKAQRSARMTRTAADLAAVATALDAYRMDFGDYPRPEPGEIYTGFAILGRALVSPGGVWTGTPTTPIPSAPAYTGGRAYEPGECVSYNGQEYVAATTTSAAPNPSPGNSDAWRPFAYTDGFEGPGFRVRAGGQPKPAYLQADKFKMQGVALLDLFGSPILYYPARPARPKLDTVFAAPANGGGLISNTAQSLYNQDHNPLFGAAYLGTNRPWLQVQHFRRLMGDTDGNGAIDAGESAAHTGPYILWSAGADNMFGITANNKLDDVANFQFKNVPE